MNPVWLLLIAIPPAADPWVGQAPPLGAPPAPVTLAAPGPAATPAAPAVLPPPAPPAAPEGDFSRRLTALELALSTTVAAPADQWRFDRIEDEAAALKELAPTPADLAAVLAAQERIDRFAAIAARSRRLFAEPDGWGASRGGLASNTRRAGPPARLPRSAPRLAPQHDAVGVLRPVVSQRPGAPKYGVVDDRGRLAALVTPAPEVAERFERLVGQRVGLDGRRGYLTDLRREHLVAERVTPLDTLRR